MSSASTSSTTPTCPAARDQVVVYVSRSWPPHESAGLAHDLQKIWLERRCAKDEGATYTESR